MRCVAIEEGLF